MASNFEVSPRVEREIVCWSFATQGMGRPPSSQTFASSAPTSPEKIPPSRLPPTKFSFPPTKYLSPL